MTKYGICKNESCNIKASYGYIINVPLYCNSHYIDTKLTNIIPKKCDNELCNNVSTYGYHYAIYCDLHYPINDNKIKSFNNLKCINDNCNDMAIYGYITQTKLFCITHKHNNMTNFKNCIKCNITPSYGDPITKKILYCQKCAPIGSVNLSKKKTCESCDKSPIYGPIGGNKIRCTLHKKDDDIDLAHKNIKCIAIGCKIRATYGFLAQKAKHCLLHKLDTEENVTSRRCAQNKCTTRPCYNYYGLSAKYCLMHKKDKMINVVTKLCITSNCNVAASFNYNGLSPEYCLLHSHPNMINVKNNRRCIIDNCNEYAYYNVINQPALYCVSHKEDNMINLYISKCITNNCNLSASFNYDGLVPLYCKQHSTPDMCDMRHPKCIVCNVRAHYGLPGNKPSKCSIHTELNMIFNPTKKCVECNNIAIYGYSSHTHCENCAKEDMNNFIEQRCNSCGLLNIVDADNICMYCKPSSTNQVRNKKEQDIYNWLVANNYNVLSHDKMIDNGSCIRNRPDIILQSTNLLYHVIVEVDENQHKYYNEECECTRMINITQALSTPVIFIRYNPDNFKVNNKNITITNNKKLNTLKLWLDNALNKIDEEIQRLGLISVIHLFYDEYDKTNTSYITIQPFENI